MYAKNVLMEFEMWRVGFVSVSIYVFLKLDRVHSGVKVGLWLCSDVYDCQAGNE